MMTNSEYIKKMQELLGLLQVHDWFYEFSDDHRVWVHGQEQKKKIRRLVQECGEHGERLYTAFHDTHFNPGTGFPWYKKKEKEIE